MGDLLRDTMRGEADAARLAPVDLAAIVADGSRTVRRRRRAAVAAGSAGVAAGAVVAALLVQPGPERAEIAPADPFPTTPRAFAPSYVLGDQLVVVGRPPATMTDPVTSGSPTARTLDAFVYQSGTDVETRQGQLHAYAPATATTTDLGPGYDLATDQDGHLAAWVATGTDGGAADVVVLDTRSMKVRQLDLQTSDGDPPRLHDVEGRTVYLTDDRGGVAIDLVDGSVTPVEGYVVDAEADVVVTADPQYFDVEGGPGLTAARGDRRLAMPETRSGVLAPDGRSFATADLPVDDQGTPGPAVDVVDTGSGDVLRLRLPVRQVVSADPVGWLDDDTITALTIGTDGTERLYRCEVPSGACEVVAQPGTTPDGETPSYPGPPPFDRR